MQSSPLALVRRLLQIAVLLILLALPLIVFADNVHNDVNTTGGNTFAAGGSTTVKYWIGATGGDGQPGCNASDGSAATVTINVPASVTVSPATLTFTACGTSTTHTQSVVFSSSTPGNYPITASVSDSGPGTYHTNPAHFTLFVTGVVDTTPPAISCSPPANVWYADDVTVSCTASDAGVGLLNAADASFSLSTSVAAGNETANAQTGSRSVCDRNNNCATAGPFTFMVDRLGPQVSCGTADGLWHASDVSISCNAGDDGSGLANAADASFSLSTNVLINTETSNASTGSRTIADAVGNTASAGPIGGNMVDKKAPSISIGSPSAAEYVLNASMAAAYSCEDGGSGVASCGGSVAAGDNIDTASVGYKHFGVTAVDAVGNSAYEGSGYSVLYARGGSCMGAPSGGILQPINPEGNSVFKKNSTVPVKFRVCDANGVSIGGPGVVAHFYRSGSVAGTAVSSVNEPVDSSSADSAFRWSASDSQWIFNISTRSLALGVTHLYTITLNDGTSIEFRFGLR